MDTIFTQSRNAQFRGPTTSEDYNARVEENLHDLVFIYNKIGITEENLYRFFGRAIKDLYSIGSVLEDIKSRLSALENSTDIIRPADFDIDRFDGTDYEIALVDRCTYDSRHQLLTLPKVEASSQSKLKFTTDQGEEVIPSSVAVLVIADDTSADNTAALIDTSDPILALLDRSGSIWERNVIVDAPDADGAVLDLFVTIPQDLTSTADSNAITLYPYPALGIDILSVEYSTDVAISTFNPLNSDAIHADNEEAVGYIAPGAWTGDEVLNAGPRMFYTDPKPITGVKIKLRQRNYFVENGKYVYTYGLARFDVRLNKFNSTGKSIYRFDAPEGKTISEIENVLPKIWNVSEAELTDVFDYNVIWETTYNSGVYTTTPVSLSQRVWIEVTLRETANKGTPALQELEISFN